MIHFTDNINTLSESIQLELIHTYQQLTPNSISRLLEFYNSPALLQSLNANYTYTIEDLQILYSSYTNVLHYLIWVDDILVGIADLTLIQLTDYTHPNDNLYAYELGLSILAEDYQNKGYGKRCLRLLEQEAFRQLSSHNYNISYLKAECLKTNLPACKLYNSIGYSGEQSQIINPFTGFIEDVIVFTKHIEAIK